MSFLWQHLLTVFKRAWGSPGRPPPGSRDTHLRDCSQELLHAAAAIGLGLQGFSDVFGIGHGKLMEKKLLVVVCMKQRAHVLGKQVQARKPHTLLCLIIGENLVQEKNAALEISRVARLQGSQQVKCLQLRS